MARDLEDDWKISGKEIWGRGMWIDVSEWAENVNAHQRLTSTEKDFNN